VFSDRIVAGIRVKSNLIEESYHWWLNNLEYILTRTFMVAGPDPAASQPIPNLASMEPLVPFWILYVRARVETTAPATMPEQIRNAQTRLVHVRGQLMGVFDFKVFDRRCHDTRIQDRPA
jgi:mediator of RNA polymerase II transcription subunit 18